MFDWFRFRLQLNKLERNKARIIRRSVNLFKEAKKLNKPQQELDGILQSTMLETGVPYDEIVDLRCDYLLKQAAKFDVPIPEPFGDEWEISEYTRRPRLTQNAFNELRSAIRIEQKERLELTRGWLSSIVGMIGRHRADWCSDRIVSLRSGAAIARKPIYSPRFGSRKGDIRQRLAGGAAKRTAGVAEP